MAGDVAVDDCREFSGTQYVCSTTGWVASSGEASCPAATPNDTCSGVMVPGILGGLPGGPNGGGYTPIGGTADPGLSDSIARFECTLNGGLVIDTPTGWYCEDS